ncbi:Alpha/Beta hydrolase protein [Pseudomassariella vexata]|uniref:Alpha/Beta hydrolase protein n=1 Tax=Pseudomassariella vexata TaxID=1141098 RepID=A0A1Y2DSG0_9PEZI|nr:Alpha/Beta hydrolase protein [Pseudomassariella vexata]ORY62066.1 Alpha/Beta hydrolase protein [Pseudomassariella vexata]
MLPRRKAGLATSSLSPKSALAGVSASEVESLPYPPDVLPGGRDVPTSYGSIRVFEWGPENGQQVLLVHGISTPAIALGDLAHELVGRGYRVMLFDLFGRGYSDAPNDLPYDVRLYVTQILLVVASSRISWTHFHLVGYSLGGCLSVSFARYFPHRLASLNLIAGGGLIRPYHVGWKSKLLYNSGLLPEWLVRYLVKRRNRPVEKLPIAASPTDIVAAESKMQPGNGDASGGTGFDAASISKYRPGVTVSSVVAWQLDHHLGFVNAFLSTIRTAHIYSPQADWRVLGSILAARRRSSADGTILAPGLEKGKVLLVLGSDDPVIVSDETIPDAKEVLGEDAVECVVLTGGHEIPITMSTEVASVLDAFWTADKELEVQG